MQLKEDLQAGDEITIQIAPFGDGRAPARPHPWERGHPARGWPRSRAAAIPSSPLIASASWR